MHKVATYKEEKQYGNNKNTGFRTTSTQNPNSAAS